MTRDIEENNENYDDDIEYFLRQNTPIFKIKNILNKREVDKNKIEDIIKDINIKKKKIKEVVNNFISKAKIYNSDPEFIIKKVNRYVDKETLTRLEKDIIIDRITSQMINGKKYNIKGEYDNREDDIEKIGGFFGSKYNYDEDEIQLDNASEDTGVINQIFKKYHDSLTLHNEIILNSQQYTPYAPEVILSKGFDKNFNKNPFSHISPVLAALFIPKIKFLEERVIKLNIGKLILKRSKNILKKQILFSNNIRNEIKIEEDFIKSVSYDPDSIKMFDNYDTPGVNMYKRFDIQILLWEIIINLRSGNFYHSIIHEKNHNIELMNKLNDLKLFSNKNDISHNYDEISFLKKILYNFSIKTTIVSINENNNMRNMDTVTKFIPKIKYYNVPVVTVNINHNIQNQTLNGSLNEFDISSYIPVSKKVVYSHEIILFTVNRRVNELYSNEYNINVNYIDDSDNLNSNNTVSDKKIDFESRIKINNNIYDLKSVVSLNKPTSNASIITSNAFLCKNPLPSDVLFYNPTSVDKLYKVNDRYMSNKPISKVKYYNHDENEYELGFYNHCSQYGIIYVYEIKENN